MQVIKRNLTEVPWDVDRIAVAITKAGAAVSKAQEIAKKIEDFLEISGREEVKIEEIQDLVLKFLKRDELNEIHDRYLNYMRERDQVRKSGGALVEELGEVVDSSHGSMRENANVNSEAPMGRMLKIGSVASKQIYLHWMPKEYAKAHEQGDIHIHDLEFHNMTTTCSQIPLERLLPDGFGTGHGFLREPQRIGSYAALACIAIQSNQNDQHGGQSIPYLDFALAPGVIKTYRKHFREELYNAITIASTLYQRNDVGSLSSSDLIDTSKMNLLVEYPDYQLPMFDKVRELCPEDVWNGSIERLIKVAHAKAVQKTEDDTFQAMEAIIHNLNTMHSRAGAQVPFSSVNYGTDTSLAGRMIIKNILLALDNGMGNSETPIFPIHVFKVKAGINYNPEDPNYDLLQLACSVTSRRLFPNFGFLDATFNAKFYKGTPETEVVYMGCRTRVIANVHDPDREIVIGRGNLNFTSINLPRIAFNCGGDMTKFWKELRDKMYLVTEQMKYRLGIISKLKVRNFPFLMGQGVWLDSEKLNPDDEVGEILKHGTLSMGFIGLAETLILLTGKHHGECEESQKLGLQIIKEMRSFCDSKSQLEKLNFTLLSTPAEGLSGRFLEIDKKEFGVVRGVTNHDYYTNSFHVPVYFPISIVDKIRIEAPYHELCNAGHITFVELDGAAHNNSEAIMDIVKIMYDHNIGYGGINHPIDHCTVCGYNGVIDTVCPKCEREEGNIPFQRIRRITGYLVGTLDRFNDAKIAEENERVKHDEGVTYSSNN
jgi:ribonucleoside-triphosphate reductase